MGGEIQMKSSYGEGSVFWFSIDLLKQAPDNEREDNDMTRLSGTRILLVDLCRDSGKLVKALFSRWNCSFDEAANCRSGLKKMHQAIEQGRPWDIVLMALSDYDQEKQNTIKAMKTKALVKDSFLVILTPEEPIADLLWVPWRYVESRLKKPLKEKELHACILGLMKQRGRTAGGLETGAGRVSRIPENTKKRFRILLVEDSKVNQLVLFTMLSKEGYHADVVHNGIEALQAMAEVRYDLVLMDCQMPVMDGYEATRLTRQGKYDVQNAQVPIVAITAHAMKGDREKCYTAGMDDYMSKPVRKSDVIQLVEKYLG